MSSYPLDEPHIEGLRWACRHAVDPLLASHEPLGPPHSLTAATAISSPASAASLVRDLLARAGVEARRVWDHDMIRGGGAAWVMVDVDGVSAIQAIAMAYVPRLILALANLAPGDREGALRALREVGR